MQCTENNFEYNTFKLYRYQFRKLYSKFFSKNTELQTIRLPLEDILFHLVVDIGGSKMGVTGQKFGNIIFPKGKYI